MQNQEPVHLTPREHFILRDGCVHLGQMAFHHRKNTRVLRQFLIRRIGDVVAFCPVTNRVQVDIQECTAPVASVAKNNGLEHFGEKLELVFHIFGRKQRPIRHFAHILDAVDNAQMARFFLDETGITGGDPSISVLGGCCAVRVVEIFNEYARRPIKYFAVIRDTQFDTGGRNAHGIRTHLAVGLLGDKDGRFCLAV